MRRKAPGMSHNAIKKMMLGGSTPNKGQVSSPQVEYCTQNKRVAQILQELGMTITFMSSDRVALERKVSSVGGKDPLLELIQYIDVAAQRNVELMPRYEDLPAHLREDTTD